MKKTFKSYIGVWAICLLTFNVIAFIVPNEMKANFWAGYIFITLAFLGQLFCANIAFKAENAEKFFYNFPLISISFVGTVIMLIVAGLTMAISAVPVWVGTVFCLVVFAFTAIAIINASIVSETVGQIDTAIRVNTQVVRALTADAILLVQQAKAPPTRQIAQQVYEAMRYSDPVSHDELKETDEHIQRQFAAFRSAVLAEAKEATALGEELLQLIAGRNERCKLLK